MAWPGAAHPRLSAADAARDAIELTKRRLFPFELNRWLALGLAAFLDQCGRTAYFSGVKLGSSESNDGGNHARMPDLATAQEWIWAHLGLIVAVAAGVLLAGVALAAVVLWLNSRGVFMYLDDVATGRADVSRPWNEHRNAAASYFAWNFGTALGGFAAVLVLFVPILWAVLALLARGASVAPIVTLVASVLLAAALVVGLTLFSVLLRDFAAPLQLQLHVPCGQALRAAAGLVQARPGVFLVYVLLKIVFVVLTTLAALLTGCATCCVGFLPVISQTILQPLLYFERAWSLFLLRQAGYDVFPAPSPPPPPSL